MKKIYTLLVLILLQHLAFSQVWKSAVNLATDRQFAASVLLQDGRVLVCGGVSTANATLASCEIFDPVLNTVTPVASMNTPRASFNAALLKNGKVLVAGGAGTSGTISSCELYDPGTDTWTNTGSISPSRCDFTSVMLKDGRVLAIAGYNQSSYLKDNEIYDPATGQWTSAGNLLVGLEADATATVMADGRVLVAGGWNGGAVINSVEIYDPQSNSWSLGPNMNLARCFAQAALLPNGTVMVMGGESVYGNPNNASYTLNGLTQCEIYNPATNVWAVVKPMNTGRHLFTASLLPNGNILAVGGWDGTVTSNTSEVYNPATDIWTNGPSMTVERQRHNALVLPNGNVAVIGGALTRTSATNSIAIYDYDGGSWTATPALPQGALLRDCSSSLLTNGKVLIAGGSTDTYTTTPTSTCVLYDYTTNSYTTTGSLNTARFYFTTTTLSDGRVLVAGGTNKGIWPSSGTPIASCEIYDPATGVWTNTGSMNVPRLYHTATMLMDGRVLVCGGIFNNNATHYSANTAEIYDPATGQWTMTGNMNTARVYHVALLLPNGKVLAATGDGDAGGLTSEVYDPCSGTWSKAGSLSSDAGTVLGSASLLPNGKAIYMGGSISGSIGATTSYLYDYTTSVWTKTGSMITPRYYLSSILLPNGKLMAVGGFSDYTAQYKIKSQAELYDIKTGTWSSGANMNTPKARTNVALLPNGDVYVVGSDNYAPVYASVYNIGLGYNTADAPVISSISPTSVTLSALTIGSATLNVTGTGFCDNNNRKGGTASGGLGFPNVATNYPVVQINRIGGSKYDMDFTTYLPFNVGNAFWDSTTTQVLVPFGNPNKLPAGLYMVRVIANGIPSNAVFLTVKMECNITPDFTASKNPACTGDTISFTDVSTGTTTSCWQWSFGDSASSTLHNDSHIYNKPGTYNVIFRYSSAFGCSDSIVKQIVVTNGVSVDVSGDTTICAGQNALLTADGAGTYQWSPSSGLTVTTGASVIASPTVTTTYMVSTSGSCGSTGQAVVTVGGKANAGIITAVRDTICAGTPGSLMLSGNSSNSIIWQSSLTQSNFTTTGPQDTSRYRTQPLIESTFYQVIVGSGSCIDTSSIFQLVVPPSLTASFTTSTTGKQVTFTSNSLGNITTYYWDFGDGQTSSLANPVHNFSKDSTYYVCLTIYDGSNCSYTFCRDVDLKANGIINIGANDEINIYPSPFSNIIFIGLKQAGDYINQVELFDVLGREVVNNHYTSGINNNKEVNTTGLATGIYVIRIETNTGYYLQKLVKEN